MPGIAAIIGLILTEVPAAVGLLNKLQAEGRTEATPQELADLGVADSDFAAAYARLFPGQVPPTA